MTQQIEKLRKVYLTGVDHAVQWNRKLKEANEFTDFLENQFRRFDISLIAEEFSVEALQCNNVQTTTTQDVAKKYGKDHIFCDPDTRTRNEIGYPTQEQLRSKFGVKSTIEGTEENKKRKAYEITFWPIREKFWLNQIERFSSPTTLFVCGSDHLESFKTLLLKNGYSVVICWPTKKLREVADIVMGQSPPSSSYNERGEGLPFFQGKAEFGEIYPTPIKYCSSPSRIAEAGDVLISVRAPVGNINLAKEKSCIGRGLGAIRAKKSILNQMFIFYFLKQNENNWSKLSIGSTFAAIKGSSLKNFEVPLLPLRAQKQIIERLDKIAEAQKLNDDLIQKTEELFNSLLHEEFNPAGKDWRVKKIKDVAVVKNGGTPSTKNSKYWNGKILWLTPKELSGFKNIEISDTERKISDEGLRHSSATLLPIGTVLFTSRAPIGYIAIAGTPVATNQGFKNFICDGKQLDNKFLYFFLRLKTKYLQSLGRGATFTEISKTAVEKIDISLPSLEIQKQIVAKLSAVQDYKKQLLEQKAKLKELFDSALQKSMLGN